MNENSGFGDKKGSSEKENRVFCKELFIVSTAAFLSTLFIMNFIFIAARVDGNSMVPTLEDEDRIVIEKVTYYIKRPEIFDVIVFKDPSNPARKMIKRVVALEGDWVSIENNKLIVNNKIVYEPYTRERRMQDFSGVLVPKDTIFVLGDNRNNSKDSRDSDIGPVSLKLVKGRAAYRIYPFNKVERIK